MRTIIDRLAGFVRGDAATPVTIQDEASVLCVHFTSRRGDYSLWVAESEVESAGDQFSGEVSVCWRRRPGGLLQGAVSFGRTVACDATFLQGSGAGIDRNALVAEGVSAKCAAVIAQLPQRPLLATFARGPVLSPDLVRRTHRLLIAAARPRPQRADSGTLRMQTRWEALQCSWTPIAARPA